MLTNKIMSLDVESNVLWGEPISIGFTIEEDEKILKKYEACFIDESKQYNDWVQKNVIEPMKQNKNILHLSSYKGLLSWFADHYNRYKTEYTVLYHMGHIVEANLFKELVSSGYIGEWDAPYTPIEVSALLAVCKYDMDSVDKLAELGLIEKPSESQKHQALYDAKITGRAYWFLKKELEK
ncbi:hypothetical protein C4N15_07285 [Fusobacterium necrophorum subsp. funduliforme]|uniref:hypothetical protein n=1 Tax=Fusobacterium necrophorum TaxID=859 RepID=UPI000245DADF|nr:hypothetical protein [Fusobacterium necrophorum]AVQ21460.1 hypothetical protein C4N15_07285 [Fusobacterium necrophorum subsp. funduliforme]EHO19650.1 hypothetical protein HMPREF9466_01581 [Fusobacterium necrophorum subsp. funduliforme 1_1_36S]